MAGSKTRFGFSGADEPLPLEGVASEAPRAAVTLTGHETHCAGQATSPKPAKIQVQDVARVSESRSGVPETVVREEVTERLADRGPHTGKSKFPAIARLLGRWTSSGVFLSRSRILDADDTIPKLPVRFGLRASPFSGGRFAQFPHRLGRDEAGSAEIARNGVLLPWPGPHATGGQMQIRPEQIDPDAARVVARLRETNHTAYLVGGCVRDLLLGRKPKDFDVATSAKPNELRRIFRNCRIIGAASAWPTSSLSQDHRDLHLPAPTRDLRGGRGRERRCQRQQRGGEGRSAHQARQLLRTAEEDARRRDFTVNGLFYDTATGQVIDHVNGMVDLEARLVRTIGDPDIRFREDPVRILRAVKFAARCDLTIESETYRRMMEHKGEVASAPRPASLKSFSAAACWGGPAFVRAVARHRTSGSAFAGAGQGARARAGRRSRPGAHRTLVGLPGCGRSLDRPSRSDPFGCSASGAALVAAPARCPCIPTARAARTSGPWLRNRVRPWSSS